MPEEHRHDNYETRDVSPREPLLVSAGVLLVLALALAAVAGGLSLRGTQAGSARRDGYFPLPLNDTRAPELQADPGQDLDRMRAISRRGLNSYGWTDRNAGVLHIPIERAMTLYLERNAESPGSSANE